MMGYVVILDLGQSCLELAWRFDVVSVVVVSSQMAEQQAVDSRMRSCLIGMFPKWRRRQVNIKICF